MILPSILKKSSEAEFPHPKSLLKKRLMNSSSAFINLLISFLKSRSNSGTKFGTAKLR